MAESSTEEGVILSMILDIVERNQCSIRDIDFPNRILDISGSEQNMVNCAIELEDKLGEYLV
jgi:transketolase C-terminal domain/subunit